MTGHLGASYTAASTAYLELEKQMAEGRIRSIGSGDSITTQPHCNSMKRHDD